MLGDNKSVVINASTPSSVLKKKHCAINYHRVREAIAGNLVNYVHIDFVLYGFPVLVYWGRGVNRPSCASSLMLIATATIFSVGLSVCVFSVTLFL